MCPMIKFQALVISLHGDTGTGKNFVSDIIATGLYKLGDKSKYVHKFIASVDYPHESRTDLYKVNKSCHTHKEKVLVFFSEGKIYDK